MSKKSTLFSLLPVVVVGASVVVDSVGHQVNCDEAGVEAEGFQPGHVVCSLYPGPGMPSGPTVKDTIHDKHIVSSEFSNFQSIQCKWSSKDSALLPGVVTGATGVTASAGL